MREVARIESERDGRSKRERRARIGRRRRRKRKKNKKKQEDERRNGRTRFVDVLSLPCTFERLLLHRFPSRRKRDVGTVR